MQCMTLMPHFLSNYGRLTCAQGYFWVTNRPASIWRQITANLVLIGVTDTILLDGIHWPYSSRYDYSVALWFSTSGQIDVRASNRTQSSSTSSAFGPAMKMQYSIYLVGQTWKRSWVPNGTNILSSKQNDTVSRSIQFSGSWKRALTSQCWIWIL